MTDIVSACNRSTALSTSVKSQVTLIRKLGEYCLLRDRTNTKDIEPLGGRSLLVDHRHGAVFMQACHFSNLSDMDNSSLKIVTDHCVSVVTNTRIYWYML
ncbi:hypothetical protein AABB24_014002 [Solanum stoloniferum]|uniref:Uncharacterized protein n=1 Tax=Solanum stoloniferum TaxID=62892 RepID=A0ABD2TWK1_9SOLN